MPLLDNYWNERDFKWISTISKLKSQYNIDVLISFVLGHSGGKYNNAFYLDSPSYQPMFKLYRNKSEALEQIAAILQKYSNKSDQISRVAQDIWNIEYTLYKNNPGALPGKEKDYEEWISRNSVDEIDYEIYISSTIRHPMSPFKTFVSTSGYFENLRQMVSSTPKKNLANFIVWNFLREINITNVEDSAQYRRKTCLNLTKKFFPQVLGDMFNKPNEYLLTQIEKDINLLKPQIRSSLESNGFSWLDSHRDIRTKNLHKLSNLNIKYLRYNERDVRESIPNLNKTAIHTKHFLRNVLTLMTMQANILRNKIFTDSNRNRKVSEGAESYSVFPYYESNQNSKLIYVPKGMFNVPLYSHDFPNSIKFAQIGTLITREIIKSSITSNDKYDSRFWEIFYGRMKCFVNQYKTYKFGEGFLPENEQQLENIADNGALRISFKAYLKWLANPTISKNILDHETLKDVDFSNTQLFFISFAQTFCSSLLENEDLILTDNKEFIPERIRVNAAISNFDEFSTEFNCPPGSIMNAPEKCVLF